MSHTSVHNLDSLHVKQHCALHDPYTLLFKGGRNPTVVKLTARSSLNGNKGMKTQSNTVSSKSSVKSSLFKPHARETVTTQRAFNTCSILVELLQHYFTVKLCFRVVLSLKPYTIHVNPVVYSPSDTLVGLCFYVFK